MKRILGTALLACLLAGCTSTTSNTQPEAERSQEVAPAAAYSMSDSVKPEWRTRLDVVGQPVVVDEVALVLAVVKRTLHMVALDLSTGRQLWRKPYDASAFLTGTSLSPVTTKDSRGRDLAVLRVPDTNAVEGYYYAPLQAVALRSGKVVGETGQMGAHYACPDGRDVCLDGERFYSGSPFEPGGLGPVTSGTQPRRWDPLRPRRDPEELGGPDATFRLGDPGLFATQIGAQRILRLKDGRQLWSRPMVATFGPRSESSHGWSIDYVEDADVYVGAVGHAFPQAMYDRFNRGRPVSYELSEVHQVVGLDGTTGNRLWRIHGGHPFCDLAALADAGGFSVACVANARVTEQQELEIKRPGLTGQLMGFDPRSGETTWSVDLDRRTTETSIVGDLVVRAPDGVVVGTGEGRLAIDFESGRPTEVGGDATTYCAEGVETIEPLDRNGGTLFFACTADGRPTKSLVSEWGVASLPETHGWRVVSVKGSVLGYAG